MGIQRVRITFEILTRADQPLHLDTHTREQLSAEFDKAVRSHVNLEYQEEYIDKRHEYLGTDIVKVKQCNSNG